MSPSPYISFQPIRVLIDGHDSEGRLVLADDQLDTSKNPLGARIWGAGCVNDGREHGIWASMVRFAG